MRTTVEIQSTGMEGQGVARDSQGNVYFVPGTLPGDKVVVEYDSEGRYRDALAVEPVSKSPDRVASPCDYFGECGGCDWIDWKYSEQLKAKQAVLERTVSRLGFEPGALQPIIGAEKRLGYRKRVQLRLGDGKLGFYKKHSHDIVDIKECAIAEPAINRAIGELRKQLDVQGKPQKIELYLDPTGKVGKVENARHGARGFSQNHALQNEKLRSLVRKTVCGASAKRVLELYCGNGNFTFSYAPFVEHVRGVDGNQQAINEAIAKKAHRGVENCHFHADRIHLRLAKKLEKGAYDTLVVDPPRQGMGGTIRSFINEHLKAIIYVSCSAPAFSKEAKFLPSQGFKLVSLQGIDMFPHTRHIEFVALFLRS